MDDLVRLMREEEVPEGGHFACVETPEAEYVVAKDSEGCYVVTDRLCPHLHMQLDDVGKVTSSGVYCAGHHCHFDKDTGDWLAGTKCKDMTITIYPAQADDGNIYIRPDG